MPINSGLQFRYYNVISRLLDEHLLTNFILQESTEDGLVLEFKSNMYCINLEQTICGIEIAGLKFSIEEHKQNKTPVAAKYFHMLQKQMN